MGFQDHASMEKKELQDKLMKELSWGGIWLANRHGQLIDASEWFLQLLGLSAAEASGFGWIDRIAQDDADAATRWRIKLQSQSDWEDEVRIHDHLGRSHVLFTRAHLVQGSGDGLEYWMGIHLDVSSRADARRLQINRARRQGRLTERETIARAIHSDIQQLLYATKTHIATLRHAASLEQAMESSESIQTLVEETIRVSRRLTHDLGPLPRLVCSQRFNGCRSG